LSDWNVSIVAPSKCKQYNRLRHYSIDRIYLTATAVVTATVTATTAAASTELILVIHSVLALDTTRLVVRHVLRLSSGVYHQPLVTLVSRLRHRGRVRAFLRLAVSATLVAVRKVTVSRAVATGVLLRLRGVVTDLITGHFTLTAVNFVHHRLFS
jgi:ABC-type bacteriocin/lantibiotic exporter with double-glycine peptidase domain